MIFSHIQFITILIHAFWLYIDKLGGEPTISVDTDWFYRKPGVFILWLCSHPLQNIRLGLQRAFTGMVANVAGLSKNPVLIPEIIVRNIQLKIYTMLYHNSEPPEDKLKKINEVKYKINVLKEISYNEHIYRRPIGAGVLLAIVFLFLYGLIYFIKLN
jgi:hypothetical protein